MRRLTMQTVPYHYLMDCARGEAGYMQGSVSGGWQPAFRPDSSDDSSAPSLSTVTTPAGDRVDVYVFVHDDGLSPADIVNAGMSKASAGARTLIITHKQAHIDGFKHDLLQVSEAADVCGRAAPPPLPPSG